MCLDLQCRASSGGGSQSGAGSVVTRARLKHPFKPAAAFGLDARGKEIVLLIRGLLLHSI